VIETRVVIKHKVGLHARPASAFVQTANRFAADVRVSNLTAGGAAVDAKSIIGILTLGARQSHEILIRAEGVEAEAAVRGLQALVESNFGEAAQEGVA
jgi:phosphotransferase system HPr (HPr) family protein